MSLAPITQIEESDYGDEIWFGGDGCGLITVGEWSAGGCRSHNPEDWSELQKQSNLIAAAPDLLEALNKCVIRLEANLDDEREMGRGSMTYLLETCSAATARAKGESQ